MTTARMVPGLGTKLAYGFGSVAYGVKNNGFDYFLLIFYSQVLGVDAYLVGLALLIALIFDAISDPLVGYFSDNTHSRLGRRHPYMYGAAIPIALTYFLLWNPPAGLTGNELFPYLVVMAILIRTLITLFEVPASGLVPELSEDYDQRTSIMSYRYFFGWAGGTLIATAALALWLVPTDTIATGLLNREGYATFGMVASVVILVSILVAAIGTHRYIPHLRPAPPRSRFTLRRVFGEIFETLFNKSFGALFGAALLGAISTGLAAGLNYYIMGFFWEFSSNQIAILSASVVISAFIALFLAPIISRRWGKKRGAIIIGIIAFSVAPAGIVLRLFDLMPANGDPLLFTIILPLTILDVGLIICAQILMASMIADLVEESEIRTHRRSEGVFFAAVTFIRKSVQGFGVLAASIVLTVAQFPTQLDAVAVPEEAVYRLGAYYAPTIFLIWMAMIFCLRFYEIDRKDHEDNLQTLADRQTGPAPG
jgi:Na+/melibiose symporter-like transporter